MTAQTASHHAERDARAINARHGHLKGEIAPGEIAIGVIIGRTSEFFDFFVFGLACVLVFPRLVFPWADAVTGTLYSFGLFALAFVARPIGSVLFMAIDGVILGRIVNSRVRERFPDSTDGGFRLGWYAFTRAMQLRMMRAPKPQVSPGDKI